MESTVYRQSLSYRHNPTLVKKCWYDTRVRHTVNPQFSTWWKLHLLYCMECSHCFGRKSCHLLPLSLSSSFWQISKAVMCSEKWYFRIKFNDASHLNFGYVYTCRSGEKKKKAISEWDFTPLTHHNERNVLGVILNGTMPYLSHFAVFFLRWVNVLITAIKYHNMVFYRSNTRNILENICCRLCYKRMY